MVLCGEGGRNKVCGRCSQASQFGSGGCRYRTLSRYTSCGRVGTQIATKKEKKEKRPAPSVLRKMANPSLRPATRTSFWDGRCPVLGPVAHAARLGRAEEKKNSTRPCMPARTTMTMMMMTMMCVCVCVCAIYTANALSPPDSRPLTRRRMKQPNRRGMARPRFEVRGEKARSTEQTRILSGRTVGSERLHRDRHTHTHTAPAGLVDCDGPSDGTACCKTPFSRVLQPRRSCTCGLCVCDARCAPHWRLPRLGKQPHPSLFSRLVEVQDVGNQHPARARMGVRSLCHLIAGPSLLSSYGNLGLQLNTLGPAMPPPPAAACLSLSLSLFPPERPSSPPPCPSSFASSRTHMHQQRA